MQGGRAAEEEMEDELERILMEGENRDAADMLEFHPIQLTCLENHTIDLRRCLCHKYDLQDPGMNVHASGSSYLSSRFCASLGGDPTIPGVYFVTSWVSSMFYGFCPLFLDKRVCDGGRQLEGMLIYVKDRAAATFLSAIGRLCETGVIPCHYLRRVDGDSVPGTLILYTTVWMGECVDSLCEWQLMRARDFFHAQ
uniref:ORF11 protein n=1 Tax=Psittacine aviadenovirus B TaxID=2169709 RepID=A0AB38ZPD6_9ADEN